MPGLKLELEQVVELVEKVVEPVALWACSQARGQEQGLQPVALQP